MRTNSKAQTTEGVFLNYGIQAATLGQNVAIDFIHLCWGKFIHYTARHIVSENTCSSSASWTKKLRSSRIWHFEATADESLFRPLAQSLDAVSILVFLRKLVWRLHNLKLFLSASIYLARFLWPPPDCYFPACCLFWWLARISLLPMMGSRLRFAIGQAAESPSKLNGE